MIRAYPEYIYEPIRIKITTDYIKREFGKYLPGLKSESNWEKIDGDIDK